MALQSALDATLRVLYPPRCIACGTETLDDAGLCGACFRDMPFITGLVCDACGLPLPGEAADGLPVFCDQCLAEPPPWARGRAVFTYDGTARRLILALKHGDRLDLVRPMARWLAGALPAVAADALLVPVPLHRWRLLARRFNQAALLAHDLARLTGLQACPDALLRRRPTRPQEGMTRAERLDNQQAAIVPGRAGRALLPGRDVVLVDDVMTTGATLTACALACHAAGAATVTVLTLARVAPDA